MRFVCVVLACLLCAPLPGCGPEGTPAGGETAAELAGPPRWRLGPPGRAVEGTSLILWVRSPLRVRLRREGSDLLPETTTWRTLAAGRTIEIVYGAREERAAEAEDLPGREDLAAGRTARHAVATTHQFADRIVHADRILRFTRPETGAVAIRQALPPARTEDLPREGSLELLTVVISDVAEGEVLVRRRGERTLVQAPDPLAEGDTLVTWRLFLDFETVQD